MSGGPDQPAVLHAGGLTGSGSRAAAAAGPSPQLPGDWRRLAVTSPLRVFAAVPVLGPSGEVVAALTLAATAPAEPSGLPAGMSLQHWERLAGVLGLAFFAEPRELSHRVEVRRPGGRLRREGLGPWGRAAACGSGVHGGMEHRGPGSDDAEPQATRCPCAPLSDGVGAGGRAARREHPGACAAAQAGLSGPVGALAHEPRPHGASQGRSGQS
jgi:hypothetical protein